MEQRRLTYTGIVNICNKARPNAAKDLLTHLDEALSQAIEDWDADELETIADAFTMEQHDSNPDLLKYVNAWKDRIIYFQLKHILEERVSNYARSCKINLNDLNATPII